MADKNVVITGAGGFVAGGVVLQAPGHWTAHAVSRGPAPVARPGLVWHTVDAGAPGRLAAAIRDLRPDAVIHTVANPNIDYCETHRDEVVWVNVELAREVAGAAEAVGAKLVHCSTDNVFDGARGMYREDDDPGPVNFYGLTKLRAEEAVLAECPGAVIARVAIVMGLPLLGKGAPFLVRMANAVAEGRKIVTPSNEVRTPVDLISLGRALIELAENDFAGVIHLGGSQRIDRVGMMRLIAPRMGVDPALVEPGPADNLPAPRPPDCSLDNMLAQRVLKTSLPGILGGLERVLAFRDGRPER
jgi:dTDP-4-dehydrorhamnose reductase